MKYTIKIEEAQKYDDPFSMEVIFYAEALEDVLMHLSSVLKGVGFVSIENHQLTYKEYDFEIGRAHV